MSTERNPTVRNMEIDAHSVEPAIVIRYEASSEDQRPSSISSTSASVSPANRVIQKIIHLKDLNELADSTAIAHVVLEMCPIIPPHKIVEVEQVIFYIQKRMSSAGARGEAQQNGSDALTASMGRASIRDIETYVEMLYEDAEKPKAVAYLLDLTHSTSNLGTLIENEVLMGALARVFREDSKKNFELATNIANIFFRFSQFAIYQATLSHCKVGALTMQLIEHELKRWDLWKEQAKDLNETAQRKWDFAMKKQDQLIAVALKLLLNLADDVRVENKMVKRGVVSILAKCLDHKASLPLMQSAVNFLWKLSAFTENRQTMESLGVLEKLVHLFPNSSSELSSSLFAVLFNFTFDQNNRKKMVSAGMVNFVAPFIEANEIALSLLYQLSIVDDAKAMITFTDAINTLSRMLKTNPESNLVKATLVNIALEKRNAQLLCMADGQGLDSLMSFSMENEDLMTLKIVRNISIHDGLTQDMFIKWLPQLLEKATTRISLNNKVSPDHIFGVECLGVLANIITQQAPWIDLERKYKVGAFLNKCLADNSKNMDAKSAAVSVGDDVTMQSVLLCGTMSLQLEAAKLIAKMVPLLVALINRKQEDDEFVLQILHVFLCLLTHQELAEELSSENSQIIEYFVNLMHDKNPKLRALCDQALQLVVDMNNEHWKTRIMEERFRWHNVHWLDMVSGASDSFFGDLEQSIDQLNGLVFDADDILLDSSGEDHLMHSSEL